MERINNRQGQQEAGEEKCEDKMLRMLKVSDGKVTNDVEAVM